MPGTEAHQTGRSGNRSGRPSEAGLPDEETVEEAIGEAAAPGTGTELAEQVAVPAPPGEPEPDDWFTAEDLEDELEGIGPPPEDALHDVEPLTEALLDEGETLEGLDEDADTVEWAVDEAIETGGRPQ